MLTFLVVLWGVGVSIYLAIGIAWLFIWRDEANFGLYPEEHTKVARDRGLYFLRNSLIWPLHLVGVLSGVIREALQDERR